jgi:hypothetical protein
MRCAVAWFGAVARTGGLLGHDRLMAWFGGMGVLVAVSGPQGIRDGLCVWVWRFRLVPGSIDRLGD